jgi:hypothetical protein
VGGRDAILGRGDTEAWPSYHHLKEDTMRSLLGSMMLFAALALLLTGAQAGDKDKTVKLKGSITCAKCDLGKESKCMTVIVAKDKDKKDVVYYFDPTSNTKYHKNICTEAKPGVVEGTVKTEGEKKIITVKTVKFD